MKCLEVPYFKQDTGYTCGPTSLQMVLAYHGIRESEGTLAEELASSSEEGTHHHNMIEGILQRGLHCYVNDNATLSEIPYLLSYDAPVIVRFLETSDAEDHYGVVIGFGEREITLHDPWNGEGIVLAESDFLRRWTCNTLGDCRNWLMAVTKEPLPMGKQYHPHVS